MRRISVRTAGAALAAMLALGVLAACSDSPGEGDSGAEAIAKQLAAVLTTAAAPEQDEQKSEDAAGDPFATIPFSTTPDPSVAEQYDAIVADMDGIAPTVKVKDVETGDDPVITLTWSWPVVDGVDPWQYDTTAPLAKKGKKWAVAWSPSIVEPTLEEGDVLDAVTTATDRGDITGTKGQALVTERPVVRVGIDRVQVKGARAARSARALAQLVDIDAAPYAKSVRNAGPRAFVEAITFRRNELPADVRRGIDAIRGARMIDDKLSLAPSREFAAALLGRVGPVTAEMLEKDPEKYRSGDVAGLSGLQARYDDQLRGTVGRSVFVVPAADDESDRPVYEQDPKPGKPLALTLDRGLQALAEKVLSATGPASALVAIRPSDGAILAAANDAGAGGQNYATYGQFAPGSTFKMVTSLALLRAGLTPTSAVECTSTTTVDGKRFKNYSDYPANAIGTIPLEDAIAQSCNTALINARGKVGKKDLAEAAATLGFGIDHDLGFPAYFGQVPTPGSDTEAAADLIGQGKVLASPMAMATVVASVQAGKTVVPRLVEDVDVDVPAEAKPLSKTEARQLKAMLRRVVTTGSGRALADVPGPPVIAKTGTAEYAAKGTVRTHAWMVAAQGDLAVAVFVETGASGSETAGPLLEDFLRGAR